MRHTISILASGALTLLLAADVLPAQADIIAQDNGADPAYNGGNFNGQNGGSGFQPWIVSPASNGSNSGAFIGDATTNGTFPYPAGTNNINTSGKAFGVYANNGSLVTAVRPLDASLTVGQTISLDFDNGQIDSGGNYVAFSFADSSGVNGFVLSFIGGNQFYQISDSNGLGANTLPYTQTGLHADFTLTGATSYKFTLTDINSGAVSMNTGSIATTSIDEIKIINQSAGSNQEHNVFANNLALTTPAPSALLPIAGGLTLLFGSLKRRR